MRRRIPLAAAAVMALTAGLLSVGPTAQAATTTSLDSAKVLELPFDGSLADTSGRNTPLGMQKGTASYGTGLSGQAFEFTGSNAISLGTSAALQPANLTVSFWFNPTVAMTGEEVFTWNKTAYNSDGWYLTSEGDGTPLALSIGPAGGQPYKVAVDGTRSSFFPTGQWTHVVATYDKSTKAVAFYRNGVKQPSSIKTAVSGDATGVLGSESTSTKTIGFNGPQYNGAHLRGLMDDYALYNGVATTTDVVALTKAHLPSFDPATVASDDLAAVSVPTSTSTVFAVPTSGAKGSTISWTSSDSATISIAADGTATVTPPTGSAKNVTLTGSATYGGSAPVTKAFAVQVQPTGTKTSTYLTDAGMSNVDVQDAYLVNGENETVQYLLSLDPEKFLYSFYKQAGLAPTTDSGYGGWERDSGLRFQGHFFGHYISAVSQAYANTTDPTTKAALLAKLTTSVNGLKKVQDAYAAKDPSNAGFVAPFPVTALPSGADGLLVPFYNLHKVLAGLLDANEYGPSDVSQKALAIADSFGTWVTNWAGRQADPTQMLNTEYGGMNEALYRLFDITHKAAHKRAAEYFDETALFQKLANNQDILDGLHANATIPKVIGALKRYTVFTDDPTLYAMLTADEKANLDMYRRAAENFWRMVDETHTYANGGNSQSEHFHAPGTLYQYATNGETSGYGENSTSEGCNIYNMLKLTRALFKVSQDVKYADFYEGAFTNGVVASQNPDTGMVTYFQPQTAGYSKVFGTPLDEFWCDHGSGIESFTKLGDSIYFEGDKTVYVNQFRASVLRSAAWNLKLTQSGSIPEGDTATFKVEALGSGAVASGTTVRLRIPSWVDGTPTLTVNGAARDISTLTQGGYVVVPVAAGDTLAWKVPAKVVAVADTENPNWTAFRYGPVLLATELNRTNVNASYTAGVLVQMSVADKSVNNDVVVSDTSAWKNNIVQNLVRLPDGADGNGRTTMRFGMKNADAASQARVFRPYYSLYNARYATYMTLIQPDSPEAQALIRTQKDQLRIKETTIDSLTSFDDNNSEADKNYKFSKSSVGTWQGQPYRDAQQASDAFFQYDMIVNPTLPKNFLGVRYYGGDAGRNFDIYLNDVKLKTQTISGAGGANQWYVQYDQIPQTVLDQIAAKDSYKRDQSGNYVLDAKGNKVPKVTVRFQSNGTSFVGGVYGVYTTASDTYGTNAELTKLASNVGTLSPALTTGVRNYTLTVPASTTSVSLDLDPAVGSGLVTVDGILIDDTVARTVNLAASGNTSVSIVSSAQDHTTTATYALTIVKASTATMPMTVTTSSRCIGGNVVLTVTAKNGATVPANMSVTTSYGTKSFTNVAPGSSASAAYTVRATSIAAGSASVSSTGTVNGASVKSTQTATYTARTC
ncbi:MULTISPECIES: beta-L-arabinofuranosidase domain-containing protein [unclassified Rathayibacter]|uniref:beta-L-arabinofuranosidase domain-containing protein n=1 Tax=unclassified Rathayibacter TaxID=2609250 RepID=UPI00188AFB67|nr:MULTISPECIES: beta-L-arabinofuranosidase domain-containing protein [unclassified Rathayibacter]MBF4461236.1 glycoside hydrolase family 127 protein [Rathayibacter sp. VKM Ac-2879]MBF4502647.1 glycoside hydrolase family 127 protein [Rathayibacter sp. VKM Ac-2878]